jgi:hypothetical protein
MIEPKVTVFNAIGSGSNFISMTNLNAIVKDRLLAPINFISVRES